MKLVLLVILLILNLVLSMRVRTEIEQSSGNQDLEQTEQVTPNDNSDILQNVFQRSSNMSPIAPIQGNENGEETTESERCYPDPSDESQTICETTTETIQQTTTTTTNTRVIDVNGDVLEEQTQVENSDDTQQDENMENDLDEVVEEDEVVEADEVGEQDEESNLQQAGGVVVPDEDSIRDQIRQQSIEQSDEENRPPHESEEDEDVRPVSQAEMELVDTNEVSQDDSFNRNIYVAEGTSSHQLYRTMCTQATHA